MRKNNKENCIIVGGGAVGILSSILLADKYKKVIVLEKSNQLGGLISSVKDDDGNYYDFGTHIPNMMNIDELDDILFGPKNLRDKNWIEFNRLPTQNYFYGSWNRESSLIDTRHLEKNFYEKGLIDFFHAEENFSNKDNLEKITKQKYGKTFTDKIFSPIIKKLYGVELNKLETQYEADYFGLGRLIMLTSPISKELKKNKFYDKKIGYHINTGTENIHYYPKSKKGCKNWIEYLTKKAKSKGVVFKIDTSVVEIKMNNKKIVSILSDKGDNIDCDLMVWTVPPSLALKAAGIPHSIEPPKLRTTSLFHFCIDKKLLLEDALYVWCLDSKFRSYRITLYPNLNPKKQHNRFTITSEVLSNEKDLTRFNSDIIFKELISLGIVNANSKIISRKSQILKNTFPVPEIGYSEKVNITSKKVENMMSNILLFGRATGKTWLMNDVFKDVYHTTKKII